MKLSDIQCWTNKMTKIIKIRPIEVTTQPFDLTLCSSGCKTIQVVEKKARI